MPSAPEMLRAFKPRTVYDAQGRQTTHLLSDALPEIIAVVARAELFAAEKGDPDESALFHELAALRSKLAGEGE